MENAIQREQMSVFHTHATRKQHKDAWGTTFAIISIYVSVSIHFYLFNYMIQRLRTNNGRVMQWNRWSARKTIRICNYCLKRMEMRQQEKEDSEEEDSLSQEEAWWETREKDIHKFKVKRPDERWGTKATITSRKSKKLFLERSE